jgi:hypothetical protein
MKNVTKVEEAAMTVLSIYLMLSLKLDIAWWIYIMLFFIPDISLIGFSMNTKPGLMVYSIVHHKALAVLLWMCGIYFGIEYVTLAGLILFGHTSFDRFVGLSLNSQPVSQEV